MNIKNNKYLNILLNPEKQKGVKVPNNVPVPSCSFQLHNSIELPETNQYGNMAIIFNPFFLASSENSVDSFKSADLSGLNGLIDVEHISSYFYTSLYVNNNPNLTGETNNDNFRTIDIGQSIKPIYDQYRLVSASMQIKYIGKIEDSCGVIGGSVLYEPNNYCMSHLKIIGTLLPGGMQSEIPLSPPIKGIGKYGNFNLARHAYNNKENRLLEGIRILYFPVDNSCYEYQNLMNDSLVDLVIAQNPQQPGYDHIQVKETSNYINNKTQFMVYIQGAPVNKVCFRCDIFCNFECLPNASYLNCLPITMDNEYITQEEKKNALNYIQKNNIYKLYEK